MARISLGRVRAARAKEEADGASWEIMDKSIKTAFQGFVCA